jgi:hypothetical protein
VQDWLNSASILRAGALSEPDQRDDRADGTRPRAGDPRARYFGYTTPVSEEIVGGSVENHSPQRDAHGHRAFGTAAVAGILALGLAACGGRDGSGNAGDSAGGTSTAAGMPGMQSMGGPMMEQMQAHMMETANADSMAAMLPMHRQMVGNMLSEMNRQMGQMKMTADARWTALSDSVRQDLVRLRI